MENVKRLKKLISARVVHEVLLHVATWLIIAFFVALPYIYDAIMPCIYGEIPPTSQYVTYIPSWAFFLFYIALLATMIIIGVWCMSRDSAFGVVLLIAAGLLFLLMLIAFFDIFNYGIVRVTRENIILFSCIGIMLSTLSYVFLMWRYKNKIAFVITLILFLILAGYMAYLIFYYFITTVLLGATPLNTLTAVLY